MSDPTCIPCPDAAVLETRPESQLPAAAETRAAPAQYATADRLKARLELHQRFGDEAEEFHAWQFRQVQAPLDAQVLEVGCGTGALWQVNRARVPHRWVLTLSDLSEGMLSEARHNLRHSGLNVVFNRHGVQQLPYGDDSFDVVFANHMLYHVTDVPQALSEIRRVLRPGGRLYAATNGEHHMGEARELLTLLNGMVPESRGPEIDISPFSMETGAELLEEHFDDVRLFERRDQLVVTEVEPLVQYVLSIAAPFDAPADGWGPVDRWRRAVEDRFQGGVYSIKRVSGFFEAL